MSNDDSEKASRFRELYRTLLTPVGLIVTVSGVFYVNLASLFQKQAALETYQLLIGSAVLLLIVSVFLYSNSHMEVQKYRRKVSQLAFGCMMVASFVSSAVLVAPLFSGQIPGQDRTLLVDIAFMLYILIGLCVTTWFCRSKL